MPVPRHFLSLRDLPPGLFEHLLALAEHLSGAPGREPWLRGCRFGSLFFNPSLRTRTAFEVAAFDLGAHAVNLQVGGGLWNLEHRQGVVMDGSAAEHIREGVPVLATMLDALGVRAFAGLGDARTDAVDPVLSAAAAVCPVPVLNLESAMDHPLQGLADALCVRRATGGARVRIALTWAPHIKPLPLAVPHAALLAFARAGHEVVLAHPRGYDLDPGVLGDARRHAAASGGSVAVTDDQDLAVRGARVVYAKSWGAPSLYGTQALVEDISVHPTWFVDRETMAKTDSAVFMHCLPVRRGVVVSDAVLDSPASVAVRQAAGRLDVQKAVFCYAMGIDPREGTAA